MTTPHAGGYRLTERAQSEARLRNVSQHDIHLVLANTVDQNAMPNDLWMVTDARNTVILSPLDSVITSVIKRVTERSHSMKRRVAHGMRRVARVLIAKSNKLDPPPAASTTFKFYDCNYQAVDVDMSNVTLRSAP